jgi:hypothetical protein
MPSPFPGMDPWLERPPVFPSLHHTFITYLQAALNRSLPAGYVATSANRVIIDPELKREPDVSVLGPDDIAPSATTLEDWGGMLAVAAEPVPDPITEPYLEIVAGDDDRLVTAIEVVSLSNKKPGDSGRVSYQQKQGEYRAGGVNLVEIDLLRGGPHSTSVSEGRLRAAAGAFDYHVCVTAIGDPDMHHVAAFRLADRLPTIPVPLDYGVPPVPVDLQAVFDRCYDEGGFAKLAKYDRRQPDPPLTPEQQAWVEGILREKGLVK